MSEGNSRFSAGDRLGQFRILRQIGEGGMGVVYLAEDERLGRQVALKVIAPQLVRDPEFLERFETEARSAAAIDHPNVVSVYSADEHEGTFFIAMQFIDGIDLRTQLRERGPLDREEALAMLGDVAAALDAAHEAGLVHRDVKPANILLAGGARPTAYLTDFGLTKGMQGGGAQLTGTGQWIGTVDYVAPEQMTTGLIDARTDVYALGCVLFEAISGSPPFSGSEMQKMWHQVNEPIPRLPGTEEDSLDAVIARATAKEKDDRYPSAGDLARAARAATEGDTEDLDEHSVATGAAAMGIATAGAPERTKTMRSPQPTGPYEAPTTKLQRPSRSASPAPARSSGGGFSARLAVLIGACVIAAGGLVAAAMVVAGGDDGGESRTVIERPATAAASEVEPEAGEREAVTESTAAESTAEAEEAAPEAEVSSEGAGCCRAESGVDPELFETYSQVLYNVDIPNGWELDDDDVFNGTFYESTWHPPGDPETTVLVDAQTPVPSISAVASAEQVRSETSQSDGYREISFEPIYLNGQEAARWVFEFPGDRRVDYFLNACNAGVAVLGSTDPYSFGSLAGVFHEVAASIRADC